MLKRAIIGILWAWATYTAWRVTAGIFELSLSLDGIALIVALMLGAVIAINPLSSAWQPKRRIVQIPDPTAPADGIAATDRRS